MTIRAVVLDIGSVLEVIDDAVFPGPFEARHGLAPGSVDAASRASVRHVDTANSIREIEALLGGATGRP